MKTRISLIAADCWIRATRFSFQIVFCGFLLVSASSGSAMVLYSDNFDAQPDWISGDRCRFDGDAGCATKPNGWDYVYSGERWNPPTHPDKQPVGQISDQQASGGSGKSFVIWDESYGTSSQWGADMILAKDLKSDFQEVFVEFDIKFDPNFRASAIDTGSGKQLMKIFRASHYNKAANANVFRFGSGGNSSPIYFLDLGVQGFSSTNRALLKEVTRCSPTSNYFSCDGHGNTGSENLLDAPFEDGIGDGKWHRIGIQLVMNSAPGVQDGEARVWIDGELESESTNLLFMGSGSSDVGWNTVMIGGNSSNVWEHESARAEQWYAIDNFTAYDGMPETVPEPSSLLLILFLTGIHAIRRCRRALQLPGSHWEG